jgi:hypothetical protein
MDPYASYDVEGIKKDITCSEGRINDWTARNTAAADKISDFQKKVVELQRELHNRRQ